MRLLLIDWTSMGGATATGELKSNYFTEWNGEIFHLYAGPRETYGCSHGSVSEIVAESSDVIDKCINFAPQLVLFRPVAERGDFHSLALEIINLLKVSYAVWMMDDWPRQLAQGEINGSPFNQDLLRRLFDGACLNYVISEAMAVEYKSRYGSKFEILRNGVFPAEWKTMKETHKLDDDATILIRYAGSIAEHTTKVSLVRIAQAVENLQRDFEIKFEILTQEYWFNREKETFGRFEGVTIERSNLTAQEYRDWLQSSDILLITYNYDHDTRTYLEFSFANKIPECLASGRAVLLHGPKELSSVDFLVRNDFVEYAAEPTVGCVERALRKLCSDDGLRTRLGTAAQAYAFENFNLPNQKRRLFEALKSHAKPVLSRISLNEKSYLEVPSVCGIQCSKDENAAFDEIEFVSQVLNSHLYNGVMVDVGAHFGGTLIPFANHGWAVFAYEPDPNNREKLLGNSYVQSKEVTVIPAAVGDKELEEVEIFASEESTGVSGLTPFLSTHKVVDQVQMVTLRQEFEKRSIRKVDFLKVDVEGHEMSVLNGLDFTKVLPRAIMLEYEDGKTLEHGYTSYDLAERLMDEGYSVYISEWWPITRYGVKHSWRRILRYPCKIPKNSWGNIIGFIERPTDEMEEVYLKRSIVRKDKNASNDTCEVTGSPLTAIETATNESKFNLNLGGVIDSLTSPVPNANFFSWSVGYIKRNFLILPIFLSVIGCLVYGLVIEAMMPVYFYACFILFTLGCGTLLSTEYARYLFRRSVASQKNGLVEISKQYNSRIEDALNDLQASVRRDNKLLIKYSREQAAELYTSKFMQLKSEVVEKLNGSLRTLEWKVNEKRKSIKRINRSLDEFIVQVQSDSEQSRTFNEDIRQQNTLALDSIQELKNKLFRLEETEETFSKNMNGLLARLDIVENKHLGMIKTTEAKLGTVIKETKYELNKINTLFMYTNGSNAPNVRAHKRHLSNAEIVDLIEVWTPKLGLVLSKRHVSYIAHKICVLEDLLIGRLATEIPTAVLRILVLRSVNVDQINILETGTLFGVGACSLFKLGSDSRNIHLTMVDPLNGYYGKGELDLVTGLPINREILEQNLRDSGIDGSTSKIVQGLSGDAASVEACSDRMYDYMLLDGDHSYEGVKRDFELYGPLVRSNGYILFDDYGTQDWPSIKLFVDDVVAKDPDWQLVGNGWRTAVFRKV